MPIQIKCMPRLCYCEFSSSNRANTKKYCPSCSSNWKPFRNTSYFARFCHLKRDIAPNSEVSHSISEVFNVLF